MDHVFHIGGSLSLPSSPYGGYGAIAVAELRAMNASCGAACRQQRQAKGESSVGGVTDFKRGLQNRPAKRTVAEEFASMTGMP